MKRPSVNDEKYKILPDFQMIKFDLNAYQVDITRHIDQVEAENKKLKECLNHIAEATNDGKSIFQQSINSMAKKHLDK